MGRNSEASGRTIEASRLAQAEELHCLHRRLLRKRNSRYLVDAARRFGRPILLPLVQLARAWRPTRIYGPLVANVAGVPLWRQLLQQWQLAMRFGFTFDTYYRYRLYRSDNMSRATLFFPLNVHRSLRDHLYKHLDVDIGRLENKLDFYQTCARHRLPVPATIAAFTDGNARAWADGDQIELPYCNLFSKPTDSLGGRGAARWIWQEGGHYQGANGQVLSARELLEHLGACSRMRPYVLQRQLVNHPAIAALGPQALCTVRIVTCRNIDEPPQHLLSIFRMPAASAVAVADNFDAGGFASPVDHATGTLHDAVRKQLSDAAVDVAAYPGSEQPFADFRLPHWSAALALSLQAHDVFSEFPSVGWDVAITPDGPVLVEGNHDWDAVLAQQPGSHPLGETAYVDSYKSFLGANGSVGHAQS